EAGMAKLAPSILALKTSIRVEKGEPLAPRPQPPLLRNSAYV
ncbi:MAG: hypothetical protein ACI814_003155, partial [Mariniblastus sp.]